MPSSWTPHGSLTSADVVQLPRPDTQHPVIYPPLPPCVSLSPQLLAVKFVPRPLPKAAVPLMMAEVELQAQLGEGHVNIITMRELILTRTHLGLVMDYASGGLRQRARGGWRKVCR